jgi:hypothetical protein
MRELLLHEAQESGRSQKLKVREKPCQGWVTRKARRMFKYRCASVRQLLRQIKVMITANFHAPIPRTVYVVEYCILCTLVLRTVPGRLKDPSRPEGSEGPDDLMAPQLGNT